MIKLLLTVAVIAAQLLSASQNVTRDDRFGSPNKIINGGFEGGCDPALPSDVYDAYGEFKYTVVAQEICSPDGWTVWFKHGMPVEHDPLNEVGYAQPEVKLATLWFPQMGPPRVSEGRYALQLFTFYKIHDAGVYQRVPVRLGARYELTAWAHAWTSVADDPFVSDAPGDQAAFLLGVDVTGGVDPYASTVQWSAPERIYDVYAQLSPLHFTAQGQTVTVFVRSTMRWPLKHCDAYFDSVTLELVPWKIFMPTVRKSDVYIGQN